MPATDLAAAIHQPYAAVLRAQKQGAAAAAAAAAANAPADDAAPAATLPRRVRVVWGALKVRQQPSRRVSVEQQAHMVAVWRRPQQAQPLQEAPAQVQRERVSDVPCKSRAMLVCLLGVCALGDSDLALEGLLFRSLNAEQSSI